MLLRAPDSPAKSARNRFTASVPCGKMLTDPSGNFVVLVFTGPETGWASPPSSQFVGHCAPLNTFRGKPEVQRNNPESCQPPIIASASLLELRPIGLPLPNGNSAIQFALN